MIKFINIKISFLVLSILLGGFNFAYAQVAPTGNVRGNVPSQTNGSLGKYQTTPPGISVKISWSFVNVNSCSGSGELASVLPYNADTLAFDQEHHQVSGSVIVAPTTLGAHTYTVSCVGDAGSISDSAIVTVVPAVVGGPVDAPSYSMSRTAFNFKYKIGSGGSDTQLGDSIYDPLTFINKVGAGYHITSNFNTPPNGWTLNVQNKSWDATSSTWTINSVDPASAPLLYGNSTVSVSAQHDYRVAYVAGQYDLGSLVITANIPGSPFIIPITLTVTSATSTPTPNLAITTTSPLPNAKVGQVYSAKLEATGGTGLYGWNTGSASGIPVPGLHLEICTGSNSSCINGTPTTAGTYTFPLTLTSGTQSLLKQFTLTVNSATTITTPPIICDYAHPPEGCNYVQGPNYDAKTGCGMVLNCTTNNQNTSDTSNTYNTSNTENSSSSSAHASYNFGSVTLYRGARGEAVKELQRFFNAKLNLNLVVDGKFGPKTTAIVKEWQRSHGLKEDGRVGPKSKMKMNQEAQD